MNLYNCVSDLNFVIESTEIETKEKKVNEDFTRKTTIIKLKGKNEVGEGEDVIYTNEKHRYPEINLEGEYNLEEFSEKIQQKKLFPDDIEHDETEKNYRVWAFESAALDLALKQNNTNLAEKLGRKYNPIKFVVSPSMNQPEIKKLEDLVEINPSIEFKLDASLEWNEDFIQKLAEMDKTRIVDLKGHYKDKNVKIEPDAEIYRMVAEKLEDALIEDPKLNSETREALSGHEKRITWDKPINSLQSIEELPFKPEILNIKPSRFGSIKSLFDTIEYCIENNIQMYGGGQFELGIGRPHIHAIASIFYPDAPNDIAPRVYNQENIPDDPPKSPLKPEKELEGLEWRFG